MDTKAVTLPGGRSVTIKRPGPRQWRDIYQGLPIIGRTSAGELDLPASALIDLNIRMVCACSVEPKFADADTSNGVLSVDELNSQDFNALVREITAFSGIVEAEEKLGPLSETAGHS